LALASAVFGLHGIDLSTLIRIKEAAVRRKDQETIAELRVLSEEIKRKQT
jgi:hypothetical protein